MIYVCYKELQISQSPIFIVCVREHYNLKVTFTGDHAVTVCILSFT